MRVTPPLTLAGIILELKMWTTAQHSLPVLHKTCEGLCRMARRCCALLRG
uniref:Uncharacterized protein n=1 Tax=Arundo donax TaxID=35708 RepID=A0A0A9A8Y3_ARUDO